MSSARRWLAGGAPALADEGTVVALSPHLDDVVFSVGAAVAHAARQGAAVTVLTVFGGDPDSRESAGDWDAGAGFRTQGEAAASRRREDERACAVLGVLTRSLTFADSQYEQRFTDDDLVTALEPEVARAPLVLVPGFPLAHPDHAWLARLAVDLLPPERVVLYGEQPYTLWADSEPPADWRAAPGALPDRLRKIRACGAYATQLPLLGVRNLPTRLARFEAARGGELVHSPV